MAEKVAPMNPPTSTEQIRNVVLIGPSGSGKTTLVESMLFAAGCIGRPGTIADGTTVSDYDDAEKRHNRSVNLSVAAFDHQGVRINLIDVPGYAQQVHNHAAGKHTARAATEDEMLLASDLRGALIEAIIAEADDEALMEQYLSGDEIDSAAARADVVQAVAHARFHPVLFTTTTPAGYGVDEVLDLITTGFPSPLLHSIPAVNAVPSGAAVELHADANGSLVAEVVKTTSDPYLGRISLVRIFSGTLRPEETVHVSGHFAVNSGHEDHDVDEKVGALSSPFGKTLRPLSVGIAGDIVAVARLTRAETGDTLSAKDKPVIMPSWNMPLPLHPMAVVAHAKQDEGELAQGLHRLIIEDPSVRMERTLETNQTVLWTLGEAHLDVLLDRLKTRFGVAVDAEPFKVPLRETFLGSAQGHGRLVKQSGGHGQFAVCDITVEPLPHGSGFEFVDEVVGGAVPRNYIPSVEKGIRVQLERGLVAGYHVVDLRVRLQDGKSHSVDSSDMAFQHAGQLALQEAAAKAGVGLLEPVSLIEVEVDDAYVGAVLGDIPTRRGRVTGTQPAASSGRSVVSAEVPDLELVTYSTALRSLSHGTGRFIRTPRGYESMPMQLAKTFMTQKHE